MTFSKRSSQASRKRSCWRRVAARFMVVRSMASAASCIECAARVTGSEPTRWTYSVTASVLQSRVEFLGSALTGPLAAPPCGRGRPGLGTPGVVSLDGREPPAALFAPVQRLDEPEELLVLTHGADS